ncbi:MAG: porphobilinogen synthase [Actinobacteria bacterium]|nr:porphobilinogen synthase [Actinomycetota bacterium]
MDITERPRRLRRTPAIRRLVRETHLAAADLILPVFVREGATAPIPISSMPGVVQHTRDSLRRAVTEAAEAGVGAVMIFGVPAVRDACGDAAIAPNSILAEAVRWAKDATGDDLPVIADLCLDEFTSHGHCGVLDDRGQVDNDATLAVYQQMGLVLADAGSDILGLSGMMDGQVGAVRAALDAAGDTDTALLAYAAKYASAMYGPFREAVESQLQGDRRSYQQDPGNAVEALREVRLDVAEGADIVMVKPALPYLDIIARVSDEVDVPVAAYVVSGEFSMVEAAAAAGMIDRDRAIHEILTSVKRAGAGIIATYWATEVARALR